MNFNNTFCIRGLFCYFCIANLLQETCMETGRYTSLEICAGAGGQALGLEQAGFRHVGLVEIEDSYCKCLLRNKPEWNVICTDLHNFNAYHLKNRIDLLAGGVPCPPFSIAGKQLGKDDERDLFPQMLRLVEQIQPKVVLIENVKGFLSTKFESYRNTILRSLSDLGYRTQIALLNASDFGVPQLRPRAVIVAVRMDLKGTFSFPETHDVPRKNVGETLYDLMAENGWAGAEDWRKGARQIAPTLVGGSKKHGGPDLGPTRARMAWAELGVDGKGIADEAPQKDFSGMPRLTPKMLARIQGFPDTWDFGNRKTLACRMIGNAFPPPVAKAIGIEIIKLLDNESADTQSTATIPQTIAG